MGGLSPFSLQSAIITFTYDSIIRSWIWFQISCERRSGGLEINSICLAFISSLIQILQSPLLIWFGSPFKNSRVPFLHNMVVKDIYIVISDSLRLVIIGNVVVFNMNLLLWRNLIISASLVNHGSEQIIPFFCILLLRLLISLLVQAHLHIWIHIGLVRDFSVIVTSDFRSPQITKC